MQLKVAVVNMPTEFANIEANMKRAEEYIQMASKRSIQMIVFPEFFPTGEFFCHRKDIPTGLENFCYTNGDEISAFDTPLGRVGIVMCWEQIRYQTVNRMAGKVDFLIGGSCWWGFVPEDGEKTYMEFHDMNKRLAKEAPIHIAQILGVPFVHASHTGKFTGLSMQANQTMCEREIESSTMVIDAEGNILLEEHEKPGCYYETIQTGCIKKQVKVPENQYWIPPMPTEFIKGFEYINNQYHQYYLQKVKPLL